MLFEKKPTTQNKWEYVIPAAAIGSLIVSCIIVSAKKVYWIDELSSYYLFSDQSFAHMLVAFSDKINNTPPLYFLLGWLWNKVFTSTELSLRLFSSLGMCTACAVMWITLRRNYDFWPASIGTLFVFGVSDIILAQNSEARMYGLFLGVCAFGILQFDIINRREKLSWAIIVTNTFIHAAIVQTHLYGLFYSGAILGAFIIRDRYFKVFRSKVYLSIVLSWLSLVPYIIPFLKQADAGNPRSWIPTPPLVKLIDLFSLSSSSIFQFSLLLLAVASGLQLIRKNSVIRDFEISENKLQNSSSEISLLILAYAFIAVPIVAWTISRILKPIFWDRYMIPSILSWSILLAYLASRVILPTYISSTKVHRKLERLLINKQNLVLLTLTIILLINPIRYAKYFPAEDLPGAKDNSYGYNDLPIVIENSNQFIKRFHYSPERNRYFFLLDWQAALYKESGLFSPQEYKTMDAWKRNYSFFDKNIVQSKDFLSTNGKFLVLHDDVSTCTSQDIFCAKWFEMRIKDNSNYTTTTLGDIEERTLLLVEAKK